MLISSCGSSRASDFGGETELSYRAEAVHTHLSIGLCQSQSGTTVEERGTRPAHDRNDARHTCHKPTRVTFRLESELS